MAPSVESSERTIAGIEGGFLVGTFGRFDDTVAALLRSAKSPFAVTQTLQMHLVGELGHEKTTPEQLGLAVQQYVAGGQTDGRFNARHFAGFVREAKKGLVVGDNRQRNAREESAVLREQAEKERAVVEEREADALISTYREQHPEQYNTFLKRASSQVPPGLTFGRDVMIRASIAQMIRHEARQGPGGAP